jgi:organic radical activating enzyme/TusA-related sulfurtransferase
MQGKIKTDLDARGRSFATGLLPELIAALRRCARGDLLAVSSNDPELGPDLERWCRFTGNTLVDTIAETGQTRWIIRYGEAPANTDVERPVGSRLWLYSNFDCNLHCDYCCVRSSPKTPRRELGLARVQRICDEAVGLGVKEIFVTGGEPFLLPDIGPMLVACCAAAPTTVLTNGMLLFGRRLETLRSLPKDRLTFQISVDSPTPERHDRHRGAGSWVRACDGIDRARAEGFRVRFAATVSNDEEGEEFRRFLDDRKVKEEDRVIRRIALRGSAAEGVALARADLAPEVTITAEGVFWHPVAAADPDMLVTSEIFPLAESFAAVRRAFQRENEHRKRLATIFNCA